MGKQEDFVLFEVIFELVQRGESSRSLAHDLFQTDGKPF